MKKIFMLMFLLTITVIGCTKPVTMDALTGKAFILTNMFEGSDITLMFDSNKFSGSSAVNRFFGTYEIGKDDSFTTSDIGMTMVAGPEEAMNIETEFLNMFNNITKISLKDKTLTFTTSDDKKLIFEEGVVEDGTVEEEPAVMSSAAPMTIENLYGKTFKLSNMFEGSEITIMFNDGKISGKAAVNNYMGSYIIEGDKLTIDGAMGATRMTGPPEQMDAEKAYLEMLPLITTIVINDGEITLKTDDGKELVYKQM